jgi:LuxR family maltose regulon positive regulatory protein
MNATQRQPFGAILRTFRVAAGLSQEELAERAHLSQRTVSDLERGITTAPYRDTVAVLADALELTESDRAELEDAVDRSRRPSTARREPGPAHLDPLLATKLAIPPARAALVPRPHLIERLQTGLHGPLTLLSAPAGGGKSTLLSAWRTTPEGKETPLAWVSLDQGDNRPPRFWRYVLTALDRAVPGVAKPSLTVLDSSGDPPMEAVLTGLLNALSTLNRDVVLMLDDYHVIEDQAIHDALAYLLEHQPPCLHLLLATRADPPLPLARLRGRGEVTELRAADLRFTVQETAAFLSTVMGLSLSPEEVEVLEARTEGWIAGLQLAGLSLLGRSAEDAATFITALTGSHRYIVDYLLDEVLLRQPEEVQRFLLHTCLLDRLCAPLCATVMEGEDPPAERVAASQEMLETLERHNVFVIALDDERRWYRYHYLFADALRQRQSGHTSIPDVSVLHRRASSWFEQQGLLEEAIGHALAGGCDDKAADLIQWAVEPLAFRGETQTIGTWLRALPETTLRAQPQLSLQYSWLLADMHDLRGAEEYLHYAEAALDTAPKQARWASMGTSGDDRENLRAVINASRAVISVMQGDAARAIPQARSALDGLDATNVRARSLAGIALGLAHLSQGAASDAAEAFSGVTAVNRATNIGLFIVLAAVGEASAQRMAGALDQSRIVYEQAIAWSEDPAHLFLLAGSLYTGLADILREQHELDAALDSATHGIKLSTDLGAARAERWIEWHICNLLVLARIKQAQGDLEGALVLVREAQEQLTGFGALSLAAILAAFEAQLHLARGDLDASVRWLRSVEAHQAPLRFGLTPHFFVYASEHLEIAPIQVLIAQGRGFRDPAPVHRALALLDQLQEKATHSGLTWLRVKTLVLQALASDVLGEPAPALAAVEQALELAEPERYVRVFADEGLPMAVLLRRLRARGSGPPLSTTVLEALETHASGGHPGGTRSMAGPSVPAPFSPPDAPVAEALTDRERDVLRLLAVGQSTPEIARALYLEVNTVRTHVKHLYGKLDVHSRDQAVWRARELDLL